MEVKGSGRELTVVNGYLVCPNCRRNKRVIRVPADTVATRLVVYCRDCKKELKIDINQGGCFESRGQ